MIFGLVTDAAVSCLFCLVSACFNGLLRLNPVFVSRGFALLDLLYFFLRCGGFGGRGKWLLLLGSGELN